MRKLAITTMSAEDWNASVPIGTRVHYYPLRGEADYLDTHTRSVAWDLCGHTVVLVEGRTGGVSTRHCQIMEKEVANG